MSKRFLPCLGLTAVLLAGLGSTSAQEAAETPAAPVATPVVAPAATEPPVAPPAAVPVMTTPAREFIIVSGGPALRTFEHDKRASHDKHWGNFVDAAQLRFKQLQPQLQPGEKITWLVYRPGYRQRGMEMVTDLLDEVKMRADKSDVNLLWFDRAGQIINYLNRGKDRSTIPVVLFEYFGHSNKACFLFDYSNDIDGMSVDYLHVRDLSKINKSVMAPNAVSKSWGCHSGELFSSVWKKQFGSPMEGAIGKTDYSHGGLPFLSSEGGRWNQ